MKDYIRPAISLFAAYPISDSAQVNGVEAAFYSVVQVGGVSSTAYLIIRQFMESVRSLLGFP